MTGARPGATHIGRSIRAAATRGRPALAGFLTAGFPRMPSFGDLVDAVAAGGALRARQQALVFVKADGLDVDPRSLGEAAYSHLFHLGHPVVMLRVQGTLSRMASASPGVRTLSSAA